MTFARKDIKVWGYINGLAKILLELIRKLDNNKDRKKCIYQK